MDPSQYGCLPPRSFIRMPEKRDVRAAAISVVTTDDVRPAAEQVHPAIVFAVAFAKRDLLSRLGRYGAELADMARLLAHTRPPSLAVALTLFSPTSPPGSPA